MSFCCTAVASVTKFLICASIPGNKAHPDSDPDSSRLGHFTRQNKKKHLPDMKVYEHQVQRSHRLHSVEFLNGCIGQDDNSSSV